MLKYERIYVSEGIDANKTGGSRECIICHFLKINFRFQSKACDGCHDITQALVDNYGFSFIEF